MALKSITALSLLFPQTLFAIFDDLEKIDPMPFGGPPPYHTIREKELSLRYERAQNLRQEALTRCYFVELMFKSTALEFNQPTLMHIAHRCQEQNPLDDFLRAPGK